MLFSVLAPLFFVSIFLMTVLVILCVYLKENFRGIGKLFGKGSGEDSAALRGEKNADPETLKRHFAKDGIDHIELEEELEGEEADLETAMDSQTFHSKRQVMQFYIDMMPRSEYVMKGSSHTELSNNPQGSSMHY